MSALSFQQLRDYVKNQSSQQAPDRLHSFIESVESDAEFLELMQRGHQNLQSHFSYDGKTANAIQLHDEFVYLYKKYLNYHQNNPSHLQAVDLDVLDDAKKVIQALIAIQDTPRIQALMEMLGWHQCIPASIKPSLMASMASHGLKDLLALALKQKSSFKSGHSMEFLGASIYRPVEHGMTLLAHAKNLTIYELLVRSGTPQEVHHNKLGWNFMEVLVARSQGPCVALMEQALKAGHVITRFGEQSPLPYLMFGLFIPAIETSCREAVQWLMENPQALEKSCPQDAQYLLFQAFLDMMSTTSFMKSIKSINPTALQGQEWKKRLGLLEMNFQGGDWVWMIQPPFTRWMESVPAPVFDFLVEQALITLEGQKALQKLSDHWIIQDDNMVILEKNSKIQSKLLDLTMNSPADQPPVEKKIKRL